MNSFYVSGYVSYDFDDCFFDCIHETEKSRLTKEDIEEIKIKISPQDTKIVFINFVYKLED